MAVVKVSYKIKRTLPGEQYDYEELYAESVLQEAEELKEPQVMLEQVMQLCRSNTLSAKLKLQQQKKG